MAEAQLPSDGKLETIFNEAANVVQANATAGKSANVKPTDAELLELYGLYKVATTGPCKEPQPGIFNMKGRTKWSAWKDKSELTQTDAMTEYVRKVINMYNWQPILDEFGEVQETTKKTSGGFAPAVSCPQVPQETAADVADKNTPFGWVKDNEINKLKKWLAQGNADVNLSDEDGLTLLHWAADRGRAEVCEILLKAGANPESKDDDEQTPLDYAVTCEHEDIVKLLEKHIGTPVQTPT